MRENHRPGSARIIHRTVWIGKEPYSDYCKVLKKYGVDRAEVYVELAGAFLRDKDAGAKDKLAAYYEHVVEDK